MNTSLSAVFSNCCNYVKVNLANQLTPLQKKVAVCVLSLFSCAALGYAFYRFCCFKAQELPKEEIDVIEDEKKEERKEIELIEVMGDDEIEEKVETAPNLNHAKVTLVNLSQHVSIAVHDVAMGILVVGWGEKKPGVAFKEKGAIYDLKTGHLKEKLMLNDYDVELRHLKIDPVHQQIIGGLKTHTLGIWNLDGSLFRQFDTGKEIASLADGSFRPIFAHCWSAANLKQFNLVHSSPLHASSDSVLTDRTIHQSPFMYHDAERNWVVFSRGHKIKLIQLNDQSILQEFDCSKDTLSVYSEEKGLLIYLNPNNTLVVHDVPNCRQIQSFDLKKGENIIRWDYDEKSNRLIACSELPDDHKPNWMRIWIRIWDVATGELINHFMAVDDKDFSHLVSCMLYLPEFDLLITGAGYSVDNCCVWDLKTETLMKDIQLAKDLPITQMSYDKQSKQLYITQFKYYEECATSVVDLS